MAVATLNLRDYGTGNAMINALLLMLATAPHDPEKPGSIKPVEFLQSYG